MVESKGNQTPQGAPKSPEADLSQKTLTSAEEGKKGDGGSAKIGEPKSLLDKLTEFLPAIAFPAILLGSWIAAVIAPLTAGQQLSIIAAQIPSGDHLELRGRVLKDGDGVDKAQVWVILADARGNRDSPPATQTDERGGFTLNPVPIKLGAEKVVESTIFAKKEVPASGKEGAATLRGEEFLSVGDVSQRRVQLSGIKLLPLPAIFLSSAIVAFLKPTPRKHIFAIVLAFLFTGSMIVYISLGLKYVVPIGRQGEVLSLGFASIYQGTYVNDVAPEWLISLTAPPAATTTPSEPAESAAGIQASPTSTLATVKPPTPTPAAPATGSKLVRGFGAPLWVVLVAVLGAGLLTVGLIVNEINNRPTTDDAIRDHLQTIGTASILHHVRAGGRHLRLPVARGWRGRRATSDRRPRVIRCRRFDERTAQQGGDVLNGPD